MSAGSVEVSDEDKRKHREAEKSLKEVRIRFHTFPLHIHANINRVVLTTLLSSGKAKDVLTG
jgi:hypothetical protein